MERFNLDTWLQDKSRKVVTRDGRPVRIVCWDAPTKNPIYGFVEGDGGITSWRKDGRFSNLIDNVDLFFADEEDRKPELTEFEKTMVQFSHERNSLIQFEHTTEEINAHLHRYSKKLLDLARKEVEKEITKEVEKKAINRTYAYQNGYENGKQDALKSLPKWKKATEHKDLEKHIAILEENKVLLSDYLEESDYYIDLEDLKTLPKEE